MEVKNPHIFLSIVVLNKIIIIRKKKLLCSLKEIKINVNCEMRHQRWIDKTTEQNKKEAGETKKEGQVIISHNLKPLWQQQEGEQILWKRETRVRQEKDKELADGRHGGQINKDWVWFQQGTVWTAFQKRKLNAKIKPTELLNFKNEERKQLYIYIYIYMPIEKGF